MSTFRSTDCISSGSTPDEISIGTAGCVAEPSSPEVRRSALMLPMQWNRALHSRISSSSLHLQMLETLCVFYGFKILCFKPIPLCALRLNDCHLCDRSKRSWPSERREHTKEQHWRFGIRKSYDLQLCEMFVIGTSGSQLPQRTVDISPRRPQGRRMRAPDLQPGVT